MSTVDRVTADALRVTLSHPASCDCAGCRERARVEARERIRASQQATLGERGR